MIGIMADSHGQPDTIIAALALFARRGCRRIYHLGDACDSAHPESSAACLQPLMQQGVITLRGNNDQTLIANYQGLADSSLSPPVFDYLTGLALIAEYQNAVFAHSLPFSRELGLSCMIRDMGKPEMHRFFDHFPRRVLFRGHSHAPRVAWRRGRQVETRDLAAGDQLDLTGKIPAVVTCGALTRKLCMLWEPAENRIEVLSLGSGGSFTAAQGEE